MEGMHTTLVCMPSFFDILDTTKDKMVSLYASGLTLKQVAVATGSSQYLVTKCLLERGLLPRSPAATTLPVAEICQKYRSGIGVMKLALDYKVSHRSIQTVLRKYGSVPVLRRKSTKYHSDPSVLTDLSNERVLYFLGFFLADGCVSNSRSRHDPLVKITLQLADEHILYEFADLLGTDAPIRRYSVTTKGGHTGVYSTLALASKTLADALGAYSMTPGKTYNAIVHPSLQKDRHFWRGVIDGDGCILLPRRPGNFHLALSGTPATIRSFSEYACSTLNVKCSVLTSRIYHGKQVFGHTARLHSKAARIVIEHLYRDSTVYLYRKMRRASLVWTDPLYNHVGPTYNA